MTNALPHPSAVRRANARDCVVVLREAAEALTLSELAAATGLSRPTVEAVLEELRASGIVAPASAANSGGAGRPARRFGFDASAATIAALDIGARTVRCLLSDAAGRVLARSTVPATGPDPLAPLVRAVTEAGADSRHHADPAHSRRRRPRHPGARRAHRAEPRGARTGRTRARCGTQ